MTVWHEALRFVRAGEPCVLVTIMQTAGSAPRDAGTQMLICGDKQWGSIGGGSLEYVVAEQARRLLESQEFFRVQSYPLGPLLAQCCGGRVRVLLERLDGSQISLLRDICVAHPIRLTLQTTCMQGSLHRELIGAGQTHAVCLEDACGQSLDIHAPLDDGFVLRQPLPFPDPHLFIFGAGHVGKAVAGIAATLPLTTGWYDSRADVTGGNFKGLTPEHNDGLGAAESAPPNGLYLIVTHSHALDYALVRVILKRNDFLYCGLIGSKTKRARFETRLQADGIAPEIIARLTCPVGLIGLKSKRPEIIAVAVAAEILLKIENAMQVPEISLSAISTTPQNYNP